MDRAFNNADLNLSAAKILVVDDQIINIQVINALLCEDYTVLVATNGEDAVKVAKEQKPDLILMDVVMPGMSGREVCAVLKKDDLTAQIPVIFITTVSGEKDENECWESGGVDFISKPFNPFTLKNRVRSHLELKLQKDLLLKLAYSDGLTGVFNRRYFDEHYSIQRRMSQRNNTPLSLLLLDIDYFKKFNDSYGHIAGDNALQQVSRVISDTLNRPGDFVARYGGEEFVVLLSDTDQAGAECVAEKIFEAVKALKIVNKSSEHEYLSLSAGIVTVPGSDAGNLDLLELADQCMYETKEEGRNRYKMHLA